MDLRPPKTGIKGLKQNWRDDLLSGFSTALVALPLALGIALASGVPPIAGIISAITGGILVSFFNGSYVTITGPGSGLIIVTLATVSSLGGGDPAAGYLYTLAAFIISGGIVFMLGLFRLGIIGDFFPSSSILGMLAAIGVIIFAKQIHMMLGVTDDSESIVQSLLAVPNSVINVNPVIGLIGVVTLLILIFHPSVENRWIKAIPAPLWGVSTGIFIAYLFNVDETHSYEAFGSTYTLGPDYLVSLPDQIQNDFTFPDFSKVLSGPFWYAVVSITLVTCIESVLSAKAADKLDPYSRHSNLSKDLSSAGAGTILSGALGGLPTITVISRSSVNINHGAKTSWSNFFHGATMLLMIIFGMSVIEEIPKASLAAILVFAGYKLFSPKVFQEVKQTGKEPFLVFCTTLIMVLVTNLIAGILSGIIATFLIHLYSGIDKKHILHYLFKPTNYLYKIDQNNYYIRARRFINFFNYLGLKKQLDKVPRRKHLVLDVSHAKLIDHTVMEHLHYYAEKYNDDGGRFDLIGLDMQEPVSDHPFSTRRVSDKEGKKKEKPDAEMMRHDLTSRQKKIRELSAENGWDFSPEKFWAQDLEHELGKESTGRNQWTVSDIRKYPFFSNKELLFEKNVVKGIMKHVFFKLSDITYHEGALMVMEEHRATALRLDFPFEFPDFTLQKEGVIDRFLAITHTKDINFKKYPEFSRTFLIRGKKKRQIKKLFNRDLILFFETHSIYHIESSGNRLLIFKNIHLASHREIEVMMRFARDLSDILIKRYETFNPDKVKE